MAKIRKNTEIRDVTNGDFRGKFEIEAFDSDFPIKKLMGVKLTTLELSQYNLTV